MGFWLQELLNHGRHDRDDGDVHGEEDYCGDGCECSDGNDSKDDPWGP